MQVLPIEPPAEVKFTTVPFGTGLLKRSASRAVICVAVPSISPPSMFRVDTDSEKPPCDGTPVETLSWSDCVDSVCPAEVVLAVTRTGVLTVPALTVVTASPVASDVALLGVRLSPPTLVLSAN